MDKTKLNDLIEKVHAYETLGDVENRRKAVNSLLEDFPGAPEAWYEKAKLLSGGFKDNMTPSEEFYKCVRNIEKLSGSEGNPYYEEYSRYISDVEKYSKDREEELKKKADLEQQVLDNQRRAAEEKRLENKQKIGKALKIAIPVFLACVIIVFIFRKRIFASMYYEQAFVLYNSGNYAEAAELFKDLGNYKESKSLVVNSVDRYVASLENQQEYDEAIAVYERYGSVADFKDKINDVEEHKMYQPTYEKAKQYFIDGNIADGLAMLAQVPTDYKNASVIKDALAVFDDRYDKAYSRTAGGTKHTLDLDRRFDSTREIFYIHVKEEVDRGSDYQGSQYYTLWEENVYLENVVSDTFYNSSMKFVVGESEVTEYFDGDVYSYK